MMTSHATTPIWLSLLLLLPLAAAGKSTAPERSVRLSQVVEGGPAGPGYVESFEASLPAGAADLATRSIGSGEVLGEQRTLVTLVNFTNDPSTPYLVADAEDDLLDETNPTSTASYVLEASYGRAWLSGSVQGWLSAGYADASCLVRTFDGTQDLIDDLDPLIDFSLLDRWIVVIPQNASCGFAGVSSLGKWTFASGEGMVSFSRVVLNGPTHPWSALAAHELGHGFAGLQHSRDWECGAQSVPGTCSNVFYSDAYDVMSTSAFYGHYTPSGKRALEWLDTNLSEVTGAGGTFWLEDYETPGTGTKVLRIPVQWPLDAYKEGEAYYVSYRKPLGFDAAFTELATDGAMLHLGVDYFPEFTTEAVGASQLIDAKPNDTSPQEADSTDVLLEVGQTFVDTTHGISIETLAASGGEIQVQVTLSQYCGNGVRDAAVGEACDGADLAGETCASLGFTSGALACDASCGFDLSGCGPGVCAPGDGYDEGTDLCTASILGTGPADMGLYQNWGDWSAMRHFTSAKLLTSSRGYFGSMQHLASIGDRDILWHMVLPFDTSGLPDGATIEQAFLSLTLDTYGGGNSNTHPDGSDQLVLVQTDDPNPILREKSDFGTFVPVDAPPEGAPRVDVGDTLLPQGGLSFDLNATGLSWIDDAGFTRLGMRSAWDVDDVEVPAAEELQMFFYLVPTDSPIQGPRLDVRYRPLPEPGTAGGIGVGLCTLAFLARLRRS